MADFQKAVAVVLAHEGCGFGNDPADPGGPTSCGITLGFALEHHLDVDQDDDVDLQDIRKLQRADAIAAYRAFLWEPLGLEQAVDQQVATKLLDVAVNLGPTRATRYFQRALNLSGYALREDGLLGPLTLAAVNDCQARELLLEISGIQAAHYRAWCDAKPDRAKFRRGLLRRAAWPYLGRSALIA